jgi:hypothetical protein
MKNYLCIGLLSLVVLSGTTLAQQSQDGSGMSGTTEHMMKEEEKGRGGNSMESVLRKIMEQCGDASKSRREKDRKDAAVGATESALDILKKRYAGEISRDEFVKMKQDIE